MGEQHQDERSQIIEELEEAHKLELEAEIQRKKRSLLNAMEALGNQLYPEVKSPTTKSSVTYVSEEVPLSPNRTTRRPSWTFSKVSKQPVSSFEDLPEASVASSQQQPRNHQSRFKRNSPKRTKAKARGVDRWRQQAIGL